MTDMRPRRFLGILERAVLGAAMSAVLYTVERRLSRRIKARRDAEHARGGGEEVRVATARFRRGTVLPVARGALPHSGVRAV